jgi:hypothetical protein
MWHRVPLVDPCRTEEDPLIALAGSDLLSLPVARDEGEGERKALAEAMERIALRG